MALRRGVGGARKGRSIVFLFYILLIFAHYTLVITLSETELTEQHNVSEHHSRWTSNTSVGPSPLSTTTSTARPTSRSTEKISTTQPSTAAGTTIGTTHSIGPSTDTSSTSSPRPGSGPPVTRAAQNTTFRTPALPGDATSLSVVAASAATEFYVSLDRYNKNLLLELEENPEQPSKSFVDIDEDPTDGVALPFDPNFHEDRANYEACDDRNASFSMQRDALCQRYLSNQNNMRYIKAMPVRLLQGRTIKVKIFYAHNGIKTIVKISQKKFALEAASEYMAYEVDRALGFDRVPTTVFIPLPLDYIRVAVSYSPLFSQWLHRFVVLFNYTNSRFEEVQYYSSEQKQLATFVAVQLWMKDVHPTPETFLALQSTFDDAFARKYFVPGSDQFSFTKKNILRSVGELGDRFIFDFIIGNTDRGMNDHNNFAYGGCSEQTECKLGAEADRIKGLSKYAYLDHGSSLHSHKEPLDNPFTGRMEETKICRFRPSTIARLRQYKSSTTNPQPLVKQIDRHAPPEIFKVIYVSVLRKTQSRMEKILDIAEFCVGRYGESAVYSLPDYDKVRFSEEDFTLGDDYD